MPSSFYVPLVHTIFGLLIVAFFWSATPNKTIVLESTLSTGQINSDLYVSNGDPSNAIKKNVKFFWLQIDGKLSELLFFQFWVCHDWRCICVNSVRTNLVLFLGTLGKIISRLIILTHFVNPLHKLWAMILLMLYFRSPTGVITTLRKTKVCVITTSCISNGDYA